MILLPNQYQARLILADEATANSPALVIATPKKQCTKCRRFLPLSRYHIDKTRKDGRMLVCKSCRHRRSVQIWFKTKDEVRKRSAEYRKTNPWRYWAHDTFRGHKHQGHIMEVTEDYLTELAKKTTSCPLCGVVLIYGNHNFQKGERAPTATIDRLNNEPVLRADNIQLICFRCNLSKQDRTMAEFVAYCGMIWERFGTDKLYNFPIRGFGRLRI